MGSHSDELDLRLVAEMGGIEDRELAAAIEASYQQARSNLPVFVEDNDEELLRALEVSRLEEERRQCGEVDSLPGRFQNVSHVALGKSSFSASSSSRGGTAELAPVAAHKSKLSSTPVHARQEADDSDGAVDGGSSRGSSPLPRDEMPPTMDVAGLHEEMLDPHLAAAIEASYAAQTELGRRYEEEDMLREAMKISRREEQRRENQALREQQELELQESMMVDRLREQEEKRRRLEAEKQRAEEASREVEEEQRRTAERAAKQARIPPEPQQDEHNKIDLQIRAPNGQRTRRGFVAANLIGQVYDFIDIELPLEENYRLVSTMPRREYLDRTQSLADAGLQGQCVLIIEPLQE